MLTVCESFHSIRSRLDLGIQKSNSYGGGGGGGLQEPGAKSQPSQGQVQQEPSAVPGFCSRELEIRDVTCPAKAPGSIPASQKETQAAFPTALLLLGVF